MQISEHDLMFWVIILLEHFKKPRTKLSEINKAHMQRTCLISSGIFIILVYKFYWVYQCICQIRYTHICESIQYLMGFC